MKLKYIFKDLRRFLFIIHIRKKKVYNLHQKTKKKKNLTTNQEQPRP